MNGGQRFHEGMAMNAHRKSIKSLAVTLFLVLNATAIAQDMPSDPAVEDVEATHEALRALKREAELAFNDLGQSGEMADLNRLLNLVDDDIVLAAMNGRFAIGKNGIVDYFNSTMTGPDRTVQSVHHTFEVADLSTLYGSDTAVAHGTSVGTYELTRGMTIVANTTWTATMVKKDGAWLLASFQFAPSIFDNPVLDRAIRACYWGVGIAGVVGLLLGFLLGRRSGRKSKAA
jgi:ketosteroid isomerase-like protein